MFFPSRKESNDSNTPSRSDLSSRTSVIGALYRRSRKGTTIQSNRGSISNSSIHTTSEDQWQFDYTEQYPGGVYSISHPKSIHSLEKSAFTFRNQSQSTVGTIREVGSVRGSIATFTSTQEIRSSNTPSFEDEDESPNDLLKASAPGFPDPNEACAREARVLESKVARVASRNFSVEEVASLQKEVDRWLTEVTAADASTALFLSSLLLKATLVNHFVFSDASRAAKDTEMSLKSKVDELELEKGRLEVELHNQVSYSNLLTLFSTDALMSSQYNRKVQECQSLRRELSRFVTTSSVSSTSRSSASSPSSRVASLSLLGFIS